MVDDLLAAAWKFGQLFANHICRGLPAAGDKWHMDEVVLTIAGVKHWLWRAVDQNGIVLDIEVAPFGWTGWRQS